MGLNLPTIDGHVAALEIRESDPDARIIFVVSKSRYPKAEDAAYSAGAVTILVTPLTRADMDQKWVMINGPIPEAPGLVDLDALYPELKDETITIPPIPMIPPLNQSTEVDTNSGSLLPSENATRSRTRRRELGALLFLLFVTLGATGTLFYFGLIQI